MSESYILHDVMRKVKADGLFDSIRRDLISDIEQKSSYLDLKSQIETLMSSYLAEHKWSSSLKKSDIRERARRRIETSNLIKDTLPSLVSQYMQTCQQQLVQPRLSSFVSDHIEHVYNAIGGPHIYRPQTSFTQSTTISQDSPNEQKSTPVIKQENIPKKPKQNPISKPSNPIPNKISSSSIPNRTQSTSKPLIPTNEEKKPLPVSLLHSPNELIDISPSPDNEPTIISLSPSPPPPVVRIASPLQIPQMNESTREKKYLQERHDENSTTIIKKKKRKIDDKHKSSTDEKYKVEKLETTKEKDTRKLRARRPNPKYSTEQFEIGDIEILESSSLSSTSKSKKTRLSKSSTSFEQEQLDTPSSPCATTSVSIETKTTSLGDISPEYGTSIPSPVVEPPPQQQYQIQEEFESKVNERSRTPSPTTADTKKLASPRRLRPRKFNERSSATDIQSEKVTDISMRTSTKTRENNRHKIEQTNQSSSRDEIDVQPTTKKTRLTSSSSTTSDVSSKDAPNRSISAPENLNTAIDETQSTRISSSPLSASASKSFIWKPKISK